MRCGTATGTPRSMQGGGRRPSADQLQPIAILNPTSITCIPVPHYDLQPTLGLHALAAGRFPGLTSWLHASVMCWTNAQPSTPAGRASGFGRLTSSVHPGLLLLTHLKNRTDLQPRLAAYRKTTSSIKQPRHHKKAPRQL
jgi:hypothetical protein